MKSTISSMYSGLAYLSVLPSDFNMVLSTYTWPKHVIFADYALDSVDSLSPVGWRLSPSGYGMKAMHAVQCGAVQCVRSTTVWHASARTADTPQLSPAIRAQPG